MSKSRRKQAAKRKPRSGERPPETGESRRADAVTIFWMITVSVGLIAELGAIGFYLAGRSLAVEPMEVVAAVLMFAALVMGVFNLFLAPVAYYARRTPPPAPIVAAAVVIALAPWCILLASLGR